MRAVCIIAPVLLACAACTDAGPSSPDKLEAVGDTTTLGAIWSFGFDAKDAPLIATDTGAYRWTGAAWEPLPGTGLPTPVSEVIHDGRGGFVARTRSGALFRVAPSAATWESYDAGIMGLQYLVLASDGTLYALQDRGALSATKRVHFRGPADATWIDSMVDVSVFCLPIADRAGNVWCESSETLDVQRIAKTTTQTFPRAYGFAPALGRALRTADIDANGTHWGMSHNYTVGYGEVIAWTPSKNEISTKVTGATCRNGDGSSMCDEPTAGFISSIARSPNGELYQLWAPQNGQSPYLMRAAPGGDWVVLGDMTRQFWGGAGKGSQVRPEALAIEIDARGEVYLYASSLQPGAQKGASFVVRLRR